MSRRTLSDAELRRGETDRVKAFTDGVFAIIITLLVLEVGVPAGLDDRALVDALDEVGPELATWVISFLLTGMYWVWHRDLFNQVRYVDRGAVWLNMLFLLPAALIPFGASVLGEYPTDAIGLHVYGSVLLATAFMRWVLYAYVMRRPELVWDFVSLRHRRTGGAIALAPVPVYLAAMAVAGTAPALSLALFFSVPLAYFVLISALRRRPGTRSEAEDYA
jgi:uncharacterized membrane protein